MSCSECKKNFKEFHQNTCLYILKCENIVCEYCENKVFDKEFCKLCKTHHLSEKSLISDTFLKEKIKQYNDEYSNLEDIVERHDQLVNDYINNVKNDVDIRIQSIVIDLENLREIMYNELDSYELQLKEEFKESIDNINLRKEEIYSKFKDNLNDLMVNCETNMSKLKENLQNLLDYTNEMKRSKYSLKNFSSKLKFEHNERWHISKEQVGRFNGGIFFTEDVKNGIFRKIPLDGKRPYGLCDHDGNKLIATDCNRNELIVFDENFEIIDYINSIDDVEFNTPTGICKNNENVVYLCDTGSNRIIVIESNLKKIRKIIGEFGKSIGQFDNPKDICFNLGYIYVLDSNNYRIQQINDSNGNFKNVIKLSKNNFNNTEVLTSPSKMKITDNLIAVIDESRYIFFYNLNGNVASYLHIPSNFGYVQSICYANNNLYVHTAHGYLICYEKSKNDDTFKIDYERLIIDLKENSEAMIRLNNKLILSLSYERCIAVIGN